MRTSVTIVQGKLAWYLHIEIYDDANKLMQRNVLIFKTLIEAMNAACTLQLHVDNADTLPLNQYELYRGVS